MNGNDYDLIQRLKDINAILKRKDTSVIARYGGIAELALFRDVRKVGVLTIGLIDENPQVRTLAADELDKNYDLGESSREVLALLDKDGAGLKETYIDRERDRFAVLVDKLGQRLRIGERGGRRKQFDGDWVEYDRRHVLIILRGLGQALKTIQAVLGDGGIHPLKLMLEEEKNHWIVGLIQNCLEESEDIFCRRNAILAVGELGLDFDLFDPDKQAYGIIRNAIDSPHNRDDYLVTRDGIQALTALVEQDPGMAEQFY